MINIFDLNLFRSITYLIPLKLIIEPLHFVNKLRHLENFVYLIPVIQSNECGKATHDFFDFHLNFHV